MCLSRTALDARDRELMYSLAQLLDVLWDAVYQVVDLDTDDVTDKGLWVFPHQVGVGEPGEDHPQGWGVGHCKRLSHAEACRVRKTDNRCSGLLCASVWVYIMYLLMQLRLSAEQHGC